MTAASAAPTIGVIIPNWNDSRFLRRCLCSVLEQKDGPDEVIVVDDRSTDDSVAVIRSIIHGHANAQLVENAANLGVYGAVAEGLKRSRSEYVLCLSANDFVLPGIFARARACLARHPGVGLWSALGWLVDEEDRPLRRLPTPIVASQDSYFSPEDCRSLAWRVGNWFTGTTLIYRRAALDAVGGFDPAFEGLSDLLAALAIASREGAAYSPIPLAVVRTHAGSYISATLGNASGIELILERLREYGPRTAPRLFTPRFIDRTARRFRYGAVRSSGDNISVVAQSLGPRRGRALIWACRILPGGLHGFRAALAFLILRPFDLVPALHSRLGAVLVRTPEDLARWGRR